jgi:autotransporter-associated beta strand protein
MKRLLWARVLRTLFASKVKTVTYKRARRPAVELLESRLAPATFIWTGGGGAANKNWSAGVNWSGGVAPTASATPIDDLVFPLGAANRSTVNDLLVGGAAAAFKSVTIAGSGYTLAPLAAANGIRLGDSTITSGSNIIVNAGASGNLISLDVQLAGAGGSRQFITVGFGADVTISGKVTGNTGVELTKSGVGTLTLSGDNSAFTGPITLDNNGGIVVVANRNALGTTSMPTRVGTNATLKVSNVSGSIQEPLILNGPGIDNFGALQNLAGTNIWSGPISLDSDSTVGGDSGSLELSGQISDTGAGHSLTKEGLDTIILSHANTYRGRTTINNGVLTIRDGGALGAADPVNDPQGLTSGTFVNQTITEQGTLAIEDTVGNGILVLNEVLTISGQGFPRTAATPGIDPDQGALNNLLGFNQWAGTVYVGDLQPQFTNTAWIGSQNVGTTQQELLISGKILDKPGQTAIFTLQKVGPGKVIFNNKNDYTGATIIREGTLNIRDSGALGPASGGSATVRDRATLELEVDTGFDPHGRNLGNDSGTGVQNKLDVTKQLILNGVGVVNTGALRSKSGINRVLSQVQLGVQAGVAAIGVDPDPHPTNTNNYFTNDYSLTLTGGLADNVATNPTDLEKVLGGQLILPTANTGYHGVTVISQGWVTAMNNASLGGYYSGSGVVNGYPGSFFTVNGYPVSLGQTVQPYVMVESGAALHLKSPTPGGTLTIPQNLILAGNGITHPFGLISGKGPLENIEGNNTVTGDIHLSGVAGIGVEQTNTTTPGAFSELTLTGSMDNTKSFQIDPDRGARIGTTGEENSNVIDTGAMAGTLQIVYNFNESPTVHIPDDLRVYSPPRVFGGSLIYDTGSVVGPGVSPVIPFTSSNHLVEIVVNEGGGSAPPPNTWSYQATFTPTLPAPAGGINKFGSKRLNLQGAGTYTGAVDVKEGVLRIQNDTALGDSTAGTTVEPGAALEIAGGIATNNGGLAAGIQVWNEQLTLSGPGNTTNGALIQPLTVLSKDSIWRGGVSLMTDAGIDVKANARLNILRTIDDTNAAGPAGITKIGAGELALAGTNTYRGATHINEGIVTVENGLALGAGTGTSGDVEVVSSATLQLQGDITVPGKLLKIIGTGTGALPTLPVRWFNTGPAAISNGETPGNLTVSGGEVTSVSVDPTDPNVIYLTGGTSGAWKTKDGGRTWTPLLDNVLGPSGTPLNVQTMYCGFVVVAPQDPRIIYVGTGQMRSPTLPSNAYGGQGILKSTDGGKTWIAMQGTAANEFVGKAITKIVIDPGANPNIIYATVANAGVPLPGTTPALATVA